MEERRAHTMNAWHSVSHGKESPAIVNVIVEITKGSKVKYEIDKESGLLRLDRVLYSPMHYPANYGFIPQTYFDDGDPLDVLVFCSEKIETMCLLEARVVGVMKMLDGGEEDHKIIAVAHRDMLMADYLDIHQLPQHLKHEVQNFFSYYKVLEKKEVVVQSFESKEAAYTIIQHSIDAYKKKFDPPS